jgi:hypothetical protein
LGKQAIVELEDGITVASGAMSNLNATVIPNRLTPIVVCFLLCLSWIAYVGLQLNLGHKKDKEPPLEKQLPIP